MTDPKERTKLLVDNVSLIYSLSFGQKMKIFDQISLKVGQGEKIGIFGPSGSGKTSLFMLLLGLIKPSNGKVVIKGNVGSIYQSFSLNPYLTCEELLELEIEKINTNFTVNELLKMVELYNQKHQLILHLSGGETKKMAFASVIASGASIILADEPFARIDLKTANKIRETMLRIVNENNFTLLMASHHVDHLVKFDKIIEIKNYKLVEME